MCGHEQENNVHVTRERNQNTSFGVWCPFVTTLNIISNIICYTVQRPWPRILTIMQTLFVVLSVCKYLWELCKKNAVLHKKRALFCPNSLSRLWGETLYLVRSHMPRAFILGCWHRHRQLETWWPSSHSCHTFLKSPWCRLPGRMRSWCIAM